MSAYWIIQSVLSYGMVWYCRTTSHKEHSQSCINSELVAAIACGTCRKEHEDTHIIDLLQGCVTFTRGYLSCEVFHPPTMSYLYHERVQRKYWFLF